ncbi:serine/threonine-protein kinase [Lignipirellula cremea]|uniref:Serine/threonine-protein kinase PrkC n=1 Tax=Lignipirellula cremea TaxID=2528010 RepID=A0A518DNP1_9BACT|nr:serine/threonine-protein kinase [Lignipirellula cremea]QDU93460.1 Serine/threonine-protein kinase PrkC [Lignipirellula cremea]
MAEVSADQLAQRILDADLLETSQIESCWAELGTRATTAREFGSLLLRRELLTNWQIDRLLSGKRDGYFFGDFRILYYVGAGTFARVYRARHRHTGAMSAVKVLRNRFANVPEVNESFRREAEMVKQLTHPNIVPVFEVAATRGAAYMVMDFVEGQNLREFMKIRGKLEILDALRITADIAAGLHYAFARGLTHRDLKLSNVLVSSRGQARIVDFGLAHDSEAGDETAGRSIDYAGLERCSNVRRNDKRSDIFFIGCMMYHMVSGVPALVETRDRLQRLSISRFTDIPPVSRHMPDVPHRVSAILSRAMDLNAGTRYQTPGEMQADIVAAIDMIQRGETETTVQDPAEVAATRSVALNSEGEGRTIMLIEGNYDTQDIIREQLKKRGYRVLVIGDPERAVARFENEEKAADCVIFGLSQLGAPGFQAFLKFARDDFTSRIPCVLIIEKSQKQFVLQNAPLEPHRVCITSPLKISELRKAIYVLIQRAPGSPVEP